MTPGEKYINKYFYSSRNNFISAAKCSLAACPGKPLKVISLLSILAAILN